MILLDKMESDIIVISREPNENKTEANHQETSQQKHCLTSFQREQSTNNTAQPASRENNQQTTLLNQLPERTINKLHCSTSYLEPGFFSAGFGAFFNLAPKICISRVYIYPHKENWRFQSPRTVSMFKLQKLPRAQIVPSKCYLS